jgi:hypothetical protein
MRKEQGERVPFRPEQPPEPGSEYFLSSIQGGKLLELVGKPVFLGRNGHGEFHYVVTRYPEDWKIPPETLSRIGELVRKDEECSLLFWELVPQIKDRERVLTGVLGIDYNPICLEETA